MTKFFYERDTRRTGTSIYTIIYTINDERIRYNSHKDKSTHTPHKTSFLGPRGRIWCLTGFGGRQKLHQDDSAQNLSFFSPRASYTPACTQGSRCRLPRGNPPRSRLPHRAFPRCHRQRFPFASTNSSNSSPGPIVTSGSHGCHIGSTPPSSPCRPPSRGGHRALHGRSADCGTDA